MNKVLLLPLVMAVAACGVSSTDGVMSRSANKGGMLGMTKTADVQTEGSFEDVQNVVVGSFKVGFAESGKQTNSAKGSFFGGSRIGGNATGKVQLEGVSDADKQEITNAAYADFMGKLKASGLNVVDRNSLVASDAYQKANKTTFPYMADESGLLSSFGKTNFYQPSALGNSGIVLMKDIPSKSKNFGVLSGADSKMAEFAQSNKTAVVSATYLLDFAAAGGHESMSSASMKVGQNLAVTQGALRFVKGGTSSFSNGTPTVTLGQPVESNKEFGTLVDETSTGGKVVEEAGNVLSMALGGGSSRSRTYTIKADPAKYKTQSLEVLSAANNALIAKVN